MAGPSSCTRSPACSLSYAYTAPPLRLKKYGLGELDVFITGGPLMVGGVYYAGSSARSTGSS